jgi:glycosyltransferase involved in cell wall biosynthesis
MRIWLVQVGEELPFDPGPPRLLRTALLAERLVARGHDVTFFNAAFNHQRKNLRTASTQIRDIGPGYRAVLLAGRSYLRNVSFSRIASQRENARAFEAIAPTLPRPDLIMSGFPTIELAHAAVMFASRHRIPSVVDCRDQWPDVFLEAFPKPLRGFASPLLAGWRRQRAETFRSATALTGITDPFVDWAASIAGRSRTELDHAFHLAAATASFPAAALAEAHRMWDARIGPVSPERQVLCFAGTLAKRLDLETVLQAVRDLAPSERRGLQIVICGKGDRQEAVEALAQADPAIYFAGWCSGPELEALMQRADIGLLPYPNTPDFQLSFPNKVGEYLIHGLPIMTGLNGITGELLDGTSLRLRYTPGDPASARKALQILLDDPSWSYARRTQAQMLGLELFDAETIFERFADYLERIVRDWNGHSRLVAP